jgi:Tfp pilus assembly protein PilZ
MDTRVLLVCSEGVARDKYQEGLRNSGVQLDTVSSLEELYDAMVKTPYNGVLIDIITKIRASQDEKVLIHTVLEEFPLVQLKWDDELGIIKSIFLGQVKSCGTLEDFINQECRRFNARKIRSSIRKNINLNVTLAGDHHFHENSVAHTTTINMSKGGCFLLSVQKWERGDHAWFIINDLKDHTPIQGTVRWQIEWGKSMNIPGIGIEFQDIKEVQLKEFSDKYYG